MKFHKRNEGFTLIELMVAVAILMISMTAILDAIIHYHRINLENTMRNESMRIVEVRLELLRNTPFDTLAEGTFTQITPRTIRNLNVSYNERWDIERISDKSLAVRCNVTWLYRNVSHRHNAATIITEQL